MLKEVEILIHKLFQLTLSLLSQIFEHICVKQKSLRKSIKKSITPHCDRARKQIHHFSWQWFHELKQNK